MKKHLSTLLLTMSLLIVTGIASAQSVPNYVPTNGLVGWWPFNGNANDESGNGNDGTVLAGAVLSVDRFNNANSSYELDGVNCPDPRGISLPSSISNVGAYSISGWFQTTDSAKQYQCIFNSFPHQYVGVSHNYLNPNITSIGIGNGTWLSVSSNYWPTFDLLNWHHIVVVKSTVDFTIYQDGILVSTANINSSFNTGAFTNINAGAITIYGGNVNCYQTFKGKLDDIGIWNRALTQQEITNLYNASLPPPCNPLTGTLNNGLVGYWPFCGNANDESGNGNNGTVNGATLTSDRFGNANSAYEFDGVSSSIEVSSSPELELTNAYTINGWFKADTFFFSSNSDRSIISKVQSNGWYGGYEVMVGGINNGVAHVGNIAGSNFRVSSSGYMTNTWYQFTATFDGNIIRLFINGIKVDSLVQPGAIQASSNSLRFGRRDGNIQGFFDGLLDDIGIWNRALTPQEISQLYNQNICYQTITVTDTLIINANLTGFNPVTYQNSIKVYPNPTNDHITIDFGANYSTLSGYSVRIDNTLGQTVYTTPFVQQSAYIDLNTWTGNGVYLIYLLNAQGVPVDVRKIVLQ